MDEDFGNPSSLHGIGFTAERKLKEARHTLASALGADDEEIIFTGGGTESDNTAIRGIARARKRRGRRIITSKTEHAAVLETCRALEEEGFEVIYLDVDGRGRVDMQQLADAVNDETILISLMHVNNETGAITDLAEVSGLKGEALFHSDCVQSFCKLPVDAGTLGLDAVSVSAHKIHGPKGAGALYLKKDVRIVPVMTGGGQERGLRSGTENVPGIAGFAKAVEMSAAEPLTGRVRDYLAEGIKRAIPDVVFNSPEDGCPSILNVSFAGTRAEVILHMLEDVGIYVSTGAACSSNKPGRSHVLKAMGLADDMIDAAVRFSFCGDNTTEEMDFVLENLEQIVRRFRKLGMFR